MHYIPAMLTKNRRTESFKAETPEISKIKPRTARLIFMIIHYRHVISLKTERRQKRKGKRKKEEKENNSPGPRLNPSAEPV
jgi:hypothetical protein